MWCTGTPFSVAQEHLIHEADENTCAANPAPIYGWCWLGRGKDRCMMGRVAWQHLSTPVKVRAPAMAPTYLESNDRHMRARSRLETYFLLIRENDDVEIDRI